MRKTERLNRVIILTFELLLLALLKLREASGLQTRWRINSSGRLESITGLEDISETSIMRNHGGNMWKLRDYQVSTQFPTSVQSVKSPIRFQSVSKQSPVSFQSDSIVSFQSVSSFQSVFSQFPNSGQ